MLTSQVHCTRSAKAAEIFLTLCFSISLQSIARMEKRNFRDLDDVLVNF